MKGDENAEEVVYKIDFEGASTDTEKGIIAHKIMEHVNFDGDILTEIEKLKTDGIIQEEEFLKIQLDGIVKAFNAIKELVKGANILREKSFIVSLPANKLFDTESTEEVLLQGVIDLMSVKDGCVEIYDYKYSALNTEKLIKKYKKQLDLYAESVSRVLHLPVKRKVIVGLISGEVAKID